MIFCGINLVEAIIRVRGPKPISIKLSERQLILLEKILRRQTSTARIIRRAKLVISMNEGNNNQQAAREVGVHRETVIYWRRRWLEDVPRLTAAELNDCSDGELLAMIEEVLMDEPRQGAPVKFTAEQVVQIMALACEEPQVCGLPISQWNAQSLATEAIKRGIVETISPRSVERFLKRSRFKTSSKPVLA
jgi:putative transposase